MFTTSHLNSTSTSSSSISLDHYYFKPRHYLYGLFCWLIASICLHGYFVQNIQGRPLDSFESTSLVLRCPLISGANLNHYQLSLYLHSCAQGPQCSWCHLQIDKNLYTSSGGLGNPFLVTNFNQTNGHWNPSSQLPHPSQIWSPHQKHSWPISPITLPEAASLFFEAANLLIFSL